VKRALLSIVILSSFLLFCSDKDDEKTSSNGQDTLAATQPAAFSFEVYLDTASNDIESTAAQYLKAVLLDGDYKKATEYLCRSNLDLIENDSVVQFLFFGKTNPEWSELQDFRFEITRQYIPVVARFNDITGIRLISCDSICLIEYRAIGPLAIKGIFDAALGEGGRAKFDSFVDSNIALDEKREYYDYAFARLAKMADSLDFSTRLATDTLILIEEGDGWKVCRQAWRSWDIFKAL
jgi:hypothetical protein